MKVFIVKKENEDKKEYEEQILGKEERISINKKEKFNYIVIKNPADSNNICTIEDIKVLNKDIPNKMWLMGGEEEELYEEVFEILDESTIGDKIGGVFSIKTKNESEEDNKKLEIKRNELLKNEECSILNDSVLIILPNGCLFIKLDKEVNDFYMNINWTSEEIN
ncbi:hypothetical protein [Clostridium ganghwense]|uniref:Uncharacterized protein n=1 Tax=Clostridium ganghwense TaxID=312089 RepID=A0ABT4CLV6_9CLOT|nr:hypothetical protein [Clostridium ganghwense]MCY6370029.1 hypothetical protein [Clostridium ganghwense]